MVEEEQILQQRKEKIIGFLKQKQQWLYYIGLAIVVWFGAIFIRTANIAKLKDVTGGWALAPDLDPYLFLRWAKEIVANGSLPIIDALRYSPLGFETGKELPIIPYGIAYLNKIVNWFVGPTSQYADVTYSAIIFPVIFFVATLIVFFLLVRKIFRDNKFSNLIALIATTILAVIPGFVHRTVAGVPEKESAAFLFLFLAFYFMVSAWQNDNWKKSGVFGLLAGISTALMGLTWGGVTFAFVVISLSAFVYFFTKGYKNKDLIGYFAWIVGFTLMLLPHYKYENALFTSATSMFSYFVLGILIVHFLLFNTRLRDKLKLEKIKLPPKIISIITIILVGLLIVLMVNPGMIGGVVNEVNDQLIKPFEGNRFTVTVAENNRPFFNSWKGSFGGFFWIFFFGAALLIFEALKVLKKSTKWTLTSAFFLLIMGITLTRISPSSSLNGSNFFSNFLFIGSMLLFVVSMIYIYIKREEIEIKSGYLLALVWVFFGLISARGAIRLLYFVYPIAALVGSFAVIRISQRAFETKEEVLKITLIVLAIIMILVAGWSIYDYSKKAHLEVSRGSVPSPYNIQWQQAMGWVRDNTPTDAVFAHWWDYGYWVQTIGQRPTVLDGGNAIIYWDHLLGRHVLTGDNETEALEFLKTHNVSYLLIDSTDIGKYTAFSSIGSDENYDRFSSIPTFNYDERATQEGRNETLYVFSGGVLLDEDIIWKDNIFSGGNSGIGGFILPIERIEGTVTGKLKQPEVIIINKGQQIRVPVNCIYLDEKIEFEGGIDGCIYVIPKVSNQGLQKMGGVFWLSPRLMRSQFTKWYLFNESENLKLVHVQENPIINELNNQGWGLPSLSLVNRDLVGPIKIWEVNAPEDIQVKPEYLEKSYPEDRPGLWAVK